MPKKVKQKSTKKGHSVVVSGTGIAMGNTKVSDLAVPTVAGDALRKGTRVTTAELPAMTDEKIWKGTGGNVEEVDMPAGGGDMLKSTYDPNEDGVIALAQLDGAVCSETEAGTIADGKVTAFAATIVSEEGSGSSSVDPTATLTIEITFTNTYQKAAAGVGRCHLGAGGIARGVGFKEWRRSNGNIVGMNIELANEASSTQTVYYAWNMMGVLA